MAVVDRHLALSRIDPVFLGSYKAAATGAVKTTNSFTSTVNATFAVGTNVDYPRFLSYQVAAAQATYVSGGTLIMFGSDIRGSALTESMAFTALAAAGTDGVRGSKAFARLTTFSVSNFSLATAASSASNSVTIAIGLANVAGFPNQVKNASAVPHAYIGTTPQPGSYTVIPGPVPLGGISFSNALATNTPAFAWVLHNS